MIRGIHHVGIHTPNLDRLVAFYRDVVGFELVESSRSEWDNEPDIDRIVGFKGSAAKVVMLRAANVYVEFFEYSRPAARHADRLAPYDYGFTHICLDVVDIDHEYERLSRNGMVFHGPPVSVGGGAFKMNYARDPDGNVIELQELASGLDTAVENLGGYRLDRR